MSGPRPPSPSWPKPAAASDSVTCAAARRWRPRSPPPAPPWRRTWPVTAGSRRRPRRSTGLATPPSCAGHCGRAEPTPSSSTPTAPTRRCCADLGAQARCVVVVDDVADRAAAGLDRRQRRLARPPARPIERCPRPCGCSAPSTRCSTPCTRSRRGGRRAAGIRRVLVTLGGDADAESLVGAIEAVKGALPTVAIDVAVGAWRRARSRRRRRGRASRRGLAPPAHRGGRPRRQRRRNDAVRVPGRGGAGGRAGDGRQPATERRGDGPGRPDRGRRAVAAGGRHPSRQGPRGLRRKLATLGREAVDGRGAGRVAVAIMRACRTVSLAERAR